MMRSATVYFKVCVFVLITVSHCYDLEIKTRGLQDKDEHDAIRRKRTFGSTDPPCNMTHGVYLERWDRIDYKRVKFLLADPRYPNLPSFATCVPTFEQPANWGNFFGSRLRTYFVPLQTGNHYFYLSSNGGSELFISTDDKPDSKTMISGVDGGFPSNQYEYDRFTNQKSLAVYLEKGKYYYMEAIMKDDHQSDHLEAALETPDGTFYKVIPSSFLWTSNRLSASQNATHQAILLKVAARAGAKAGSSFGAKWAMKSGAKAGAKAGGLAGMAAGASGGATAGEKSAINTFKQTMEDALNTLHGDNLHKFNIIIKNGRVVDVTGPGIGGAVGVGATSGASAAGAAVAGASMGSVGVVGAGGGGGGGGAGGGGGMAGAGGTPWTAAGGVGVGGAGGGGGGGGAAMAGGGQEVSGGAATSASTGAGMVAGAGAGAGASASSGAQAGGAGGVTVGGGVTTGGSSAGVITGAAGATGGGGGAYGGGTGGSFGLEYSGVRQITYIPKPGEDPQTAARALVWRVGGASRIVGNALYTVHSWDIPYAQENSSLNYCWQAKNGDVKLAPFCQVFTVRIPGLYKGAKEKFNTMSFESVCLPGYYLKQKNYHMILQKRDGSDLFDKESTFTAISVMKFARNYLLKSTHKDWYICQAKKKSIHINPDLMLDFYNGDPDVLNRCTFLFHPIPQTDNKYKMCKNVVGPVKHPSISGQPLPHPPHLVPKTQPPAVALPSCIPVCPAGTTSGASGQMTSLGSSSHIVPTKPGSPEDHFKPSSIRSKKVCVAVNFINNFGSQFTLYSSLKHEGYLVDGSGFKLKLMIDRPELHSHVAFYAKDPLGKRKIFLNGKLSTSEAAVAGCPEFVDVSVTPEQGIYPGTTSSTSQPGVPGTSMLPPSTSLAHPAPSSHALSPPAVPPASSPTPLLPPPPASIPNHNHHLPPPSHHHPAPSAFTAAPPAAPSSTRSASSPAILKPTVQGASTSEGNHQAVHYHYHYHGKKGPMAPSVCPSSCSGSEECHPTCPSRCCKRDFDEVVSGDEDITVA